MSVLPQALSGQVPEPTKQLVTRGIGNIQLSTVFWLIAVVSGIVIPAPISWAVCFVIALLAVAMTLSGITRLKAVREGTYLKEIAGLSAALPEKATPGQLPAATGEVVPPVSVTEGTTDLLKRSGQQ